MTTRFTMTGFAMAVALAAPAAAGAQDLDFSYVEGGFIAGFVNDVEDSGVIADTGGALALESDAGGGGFIGGAWQFGDNLHLFGEYASMSQELEASDGTDTVEGEYDVVRWRVGVGYAHPVSPAFGLYGRLGFDSVEFKSVEVAGFDLDADVDADGIGAEVGMIWAVKPSIRLQGHVRYTAVGEVAPEASDSFDPDILVGLNARWNFRPNLALVTGYEFGKITTLNVGLRYSF